MPPTTIRLSDNKILTEDQKSIISLLVEYRSLTTRQILEELPTNKSIQQVRRDLVKLKELEMISPFEIISHKPGANEAGWLLRIRGAAAIGANYDSSYLRKPGPQKREIKAQELELIGQVIKGAGWELIQPQNYNSANRKPEKTEQNKLLVEAYRQALYKDLLERQARYPKSPGLSDDIKSYNVEMYRSLVPKGANDWLASLDIVNPQDQTSQRVAAVLILCPNQDTIRFWRQRIKMYEKIAKRIAIIGVFKDVEEGGVSTKILTKAGLQNCLLANVKDTLNLLEEKTLNESV